MSIHRSEYVNEFGDRWFFELDQEQGIALLRGTDIEENLRVPVIERFAFDLVLDSGEQEWLQNVWNAGAEGIPAFALYRGMDTEFLAASKFCKLTNDYCPICLRVKKEFDVHHCIWSTVGGTSENFNLLKVCRSCHALLTHGSSEDRITRNLAAYYHQFMHFGMQFIPRQAPSLGKHRDRRFLDGCPKLQRLTDHFSGAPHTEKEEIDGAIRYFARVFYQYYRDVARGIPAFVGHHAHHAAMLESLERRIGRRP